MAFRNINKTGITNTVNSCLDYIGPSAPNAYRLISEVGERDYYGNRLETTRRFPITIALGVEKTQVEMVEGGEKPKTSIHFNVKADVTLEKGDLVEINDVTYIVDIIRNVDIGDGVVCKGGQLIRRRD